MKQVILSGSSRKNSTSLTVAKALQRVLKEAGSVETEVLSFEQYDIPFFNQPLDPENLSPFQSGLRDAMTTADAIIVVSPEYNWFPSAELVHLIHRFGDSPFEAMWDHKVFSFVGVSTGRGGRMPAVQLASVVDKIISVFEFDSITNPRNFEVQFAKRVLDQEGRSLGVAEFDRGMEQFIRYHLQVCERWTAH